MSKISNYFTSRESTYSETAVSHNLQNVPNAEQLDNIRYTAARMDTLRIFLDQPLYVNSWFRSEEVNKLVGGVPTSDHKKGLAVDIRPSKTELVATFNKIKDSNLSFKQLILYKTFIHISYCRNIEDEKRQVLYSNK